MEKKSILILLILFVVVAGAIYGIFFLPSADGNETFEKITLGGVTFNIPPDYTFLDSNETADAFVNKYEDFIYRNGDRTKDYLEIYVYKNMSVQQVVSNISSSEKITAQAKSYGNYSGYWFDHDLFKFKNYFFIFEKDGKTVGISFSSPYQDKVIENL